jgi:hypothetical protein
MKKKHSSWVHLRSLNVNDIKVSTLCGKTSSTIRSTFKRAQTTCPECINVYKIKGQK